MKNNTPHYPLEVSDSVVANQPNPFVLALALTALLYFSAGTTLQKSAVKAQQGEQTSLMLTPALKKAILQDLSGRSEMPESALEIVEAMPHTWQDECLELQEEGRFCPAGVISGWQVVVADGVERWVYRTNASGSVVKLHRTQATPRLS